LANRIVDFVALSVRVVVEVDGASHVGRERADARRNAELERAGFRVLHVEARSVMRELASVLRTIRDAVGSR
jgi:leucyl-tRNA synthetase